MNRRSMLGASTMALLGLVSVTRRAAAQEKTLKQQLIGAWLLTSIYDQTTDGNKHEFWGPGVQGSLMLSPTGRFSLLITAANREKASQNPQNPVGPALGYFGTYKVDEGARTLTYQVESSTFPQWIGTSRTATVQSITADELQVVQAIVHDPVNGDLVPHFGWKRANPA
jgi:Lipocalin-like domain